MKLGGVGQTKRILILISLLAIRLVFNDYSSTRDVNVKSLSLKGKVDKVYQLETKCIYESSDWKGEKMGKCDLKRDVWVSVTGKPERNLIINLSNKKYLRIATIEVDYQNSNLSDKSVFVRNQLTNKYRAYLNHREAALAAGVVVGDDSFMGYKQREDYKTAGVMHIVVVSGFNLFFIFGPLLNLLLLFMERRIAMSVSLIILLGYVWLTGAEIPVMRAYLMLLILGSASLIGRKTVGWWSLIVSVFCLLWWNFSMIVDPSFLLSVMASIGLIISGQFERYFDIQNNRLMHLSQLFGITTTVVCTLITTPILWFFFGQVSMIGIITNSLVGFVIPLVTGLGLLFLILPAVVTIPLQLLLGYINWIVDLVTYAI